MKLAPLIASGLLVLGLASCAADPAENTPSTGGRTGSSTGGRTGTSTGGSSGNNSGGGTGSGTGGSGTSSGGGTGSGTGGDTGSGTGGDTGSGGTGGDTGSGGSGSGGKGGKGGSTGGADAGDTDAGGGDEVPTPSNPGGPGSAVNLTGDATKRGPMVYTTSCEKCHGPMGMGGVPNPNSEDGTVPPLNPIDPLLKSATKKTFATNIDLFLEHGSTPSGSKPTFVMPAFGIDFAKNTDKTVVKLSSQQIADVIAYVMSLNK